MILYLSVKKIMRIYYITPNNQVEDNEDIIIIHYLGYCYIMFKFHLKKNKCSKYPP